MNSQTKTSPSVDPKTYNSEYYRSSNYADYLERADRYKKTAYELADLFRKLNLVSKDKPVLDYGCAVGFLVEGFVQAGMPAYGYEISDWAIAEAKRRNPDLAIRHYDPIHIGFSYNGERHLYHPSEQPAVMTVLDVFEHMTDEQIAEAIQVIQPCAMVVRIPSSTDGGKTFALEVSRADPTHINCKTKEQWIEFFKKFGYNTFLRLNLYTVYDTPGVTCLLIL